MGDSPEVVSECNSIQVLCRDSPNAAQALIDTADVCRTGVDTPLPEHHTHQQCQRARQGQEEHAQVRAGYLSPEPNVPDIARCRNRLHLRSEDSSPHVWRILTRNAHISDGTAVRSGRRHGRSQTGQCMAMQFPHTNWDWRECPAGFRSERFPSISGQLCGTSLSLVMS